MDKRPGSVVSLWERAVAAMAHAFNPKATTSTAPEHADHFAALDALRGVAALAVVFHHFSTRIDLGGFFAHGYLAVDFFFVLSGFVIAHAYGPRLANGAMSVGRFVLIRAIRLLPLVFLGTLIAVAIEWRRPDILDQGVHFKDTLLALVFGDLLVPTLWPTSLQPNVAFPLNVVVWSLFFEAAANLFYAPLAHLRRGRWILVATAAVSAIMIVKGAEIFGAVNFGAEITGFGYGFARVGWSFSLGLALFRWRAWAPRIPFGWIVAGLVILLGAPDLGGWNAVFDETCVFVLLPMIVFGAIRTGFGAKGRLVAAISGDLSYPLYATHLPLLRAICFVAVKWDLPLAGRMAVAGAGTLVVVAAALLFYVYFDVPVRRALSSLLLSRKSVPPHTSIDACRNT